MPESPLTISYLDLLAEVGFMMGYGRDREAWTADQDVEVDFLVQSGVRKFYWPAVGVSGQPHSWRFFRPTYTLTTVSGQEDYDAPDDFGGMIGKAYFGQDQGWTPLDLVPEGVILDSRQGTLSGRPRMMAVRPKAFDPETGQRWEFILAPNPDGEYDLYIPYNVLPSVKPSVDEPYIYGGVAHSETVLAACRAEAEFRLNKQHGEHWKDFQALLSASIAADLRVSEPAYLGKNLDRSDGGRMPRRSDSQVNYVGPAYG